MWASEKEVKVPHPLYVMTHCEANKLRRWKQFSSSLFVWDGSLTRMVAFRAAGESRAQMSIVSADCKTSSNWYLTHSCQLVACQVTHECRHVKSSRHRWKTTFANFGNMCQVKVCATPADDCRTQRCFANSCGRSFRSRCAVPFALIVVLCHERNLAAAPISGINLLRKTLCYPRERCKRLLFACTMLVTLHIVVCRFYVRCR